MTAQDALEYIADHTGSKFQARSTIIDAMHAGDLTTTARKMWYVSDIDPTDEWCEITKKAQLEFEEIELPSDFWTASCQWPEETRHWRWKEGNFLLNASEADVDPFYGQALEGVEFDFREVMKLVGKSERSGAGGRKPDKERWAKFWINFLYDVSADLFDWGQFENKKQLKQAMMRGRNRDIFAPNNIDFAVDLAWTELVERSRLEDTGTKRNRVGDELMSRGLDKNI